MRIDIASTGFYALNNQIVYLAARIMNRRVIHIHPHIIPEVDIHIEDN
jgi:hypothetical protein